MGHLPLDEFPLGLIAGTASCGPHFCVNNREPLKAWLAFLGRTYHPPPSGPCVQAEILRESNEGAFHHPLGRSRGILQRFSSLASGKAATLLFSVEAVRIPKPVNRCGGIPVQDAQNLVSDG